MRTPLLLSVAAVLLAGPAARAKDTPSLEGSWEGLLKVNAAVELRLVLNATKEKSGALKATLDSPDQGVTGIPVDSIALKDGAVTFTAKQIGASYSGKMNDAGTEIAGDFTQGGKLP